MGCGGTGDGEAQEQPSLDWRSVAQPVRLNLGAGGKTIPGFYSVDLANNASGIKPDFDCDLRRLPFPDDWAEEIIAVHVIEHFYIWEVADVLKEWQRVLKPGGRLIVECPCLEKVMHFFHLASTGQAKVDFQCLWLALYGDPSSKTVEMTHKWCYGIGQIKQLFRTVGFTGVSREEAVYHMPARDMRIIGYKQEFRDGTE